MGFGIGDTRNRNAGGVRVAWALASTLSLASWSCAPKAPDASLVGGGAAGVGAGGSLASGGSSAGGNSSAGGAGGSGGLVLSVNDGGKSFGGIASVDSNASGSAGVHESRDLRADRPFEGLQRLETTEEFVSGLPLFCNQE